jgi:hypothetical protein
MKFNWISARKFEINQIVNLQCEGKMLSIKVEKCEEAEDDDELKAQFEPAVTLWEYEGEVQ